MQRESVPILNALPIMKEALSLSTREAVMEVCFVLTATAR